MQHGKGKNVWDRKPDEVFLNFYDGDWAHSSMTGQGKRQWPSGNTYEGEWQNNMKHGFGKFVWKREPNDVAENFYDGQWKYDKMSGMGKRQYGNGVIFIGQWIDGKQQVNGRYVFKDEQKVVKEQIDAGDQSTDDYSSKEETQSDKEQICDILKQLESGNVKDSIERKSDSEENASEGKHDCSEGHDEDPVYGNKLQGQGFRFGCHQQPKKFKGYKRQIWKPEQLSESEKVQISE